MAINLKTLLVKIRADATEYKQGVDEAQGATQKFGVDMKGLVAGAAAGAFALAANEARKFVQESREEFKEFQTGFSEVMTLLPDASEQSFALMKDDLLDFDVDAGRLSDETIPGLYQAISAGVPDDNVFDFMAIASDAALGGVTDLETAIDGITSVTNAYGVEAISAQQASDLMFTAVKGGKTTFDELSNSLFNVIPTAASVGLEFGNVTAALATMTAQGTPTSVATTQLRQLLIELTTTGSDAADMFERLTGGSVQQFIDQGGNLQQVLEILEQGAADNNASLRDMFGSVEAGSAALSLTGAASQKFTAELLNAEAAEGATAAAADTMSGSIEHSEARAEAAAEKFKILVGEGLEPTEQAFLKVKTAALELINASLEMGNVEDFVTENLVDHVDQLEASTIAGAEFTSQQDALGRMMFIVSRETLALNAEILDTDRQMRRAHIASELLGAGLETTDQGLLDLVNSFEALTPDVQARMLAEFTEGLGTADSQLVGFGGDLTETELRMLKFADGVVGGTGAVDDFGAAVAGAIPENEAFNDKLAQQGNFVSEAEGRLRGLQQQHDRNYLELVRGQEATEAYNQAVDDFNATLADNFNSFLNSSGVVGFYNETLDQLNSGQAEATLNQDALNQAMFDAAAAGGADAASLAILGGALGLYSEEATQAALKSALIQAKINELAAAYVDGSIGVGEMQTSLANFIAGLDEVGPAADGAATSVGNATAALSEQDAALAEKLGVFDEAAGTAAGEAETAFGDIEAAAETHMPAAASIVDEQAGAILGSVETAFGEMPGTAEGAMGEMVGAAETGMGELVSAVGTGMTDAVTTADGYVVQFGAVGTNIVSSMTTELLAGGGALSAAAQQIVLDALAAAEAAAEAQSPSERARRLGRNIDFGLVLGLSDEEQAVLDQVGEMMGRVFDVVGETISTGSALGRIGGFFGDMIFGAAEAELAGIDERMEGLEESIADRLGGFLPDLAEDFDAALAAARRSGDADLVAELESYRDLQLERNEAEEAFVAAQERVLELQERQQQLDFLQQQLNLMRTLQEAGLNPAEVLEGINLGLDASADDLLSATEAVMGAVIAEADAQLGQAQDVAAAGWGAMVDGSEEALGGFAEMIGELFGDVLSEVEGASGGFGPAGEAAGQAWGAGFATGAMGGAGGLGGGVDRMGNPIPQGATMAEVMAGQLGAAGVGSALDAGGIANLIGRVRGGVGGGLPATTGIGGGGAGVTSAGGDVVGRGANGEWVINLNFYGDVYGVEDFDARVQAAVNGGLGARIDRRVRS